MFNTTALFILLTGFCTMLPSQYRIMPAQSKSTSPRIEETTLPCSKSRRCYSPITNTSQGRALASETLKKLKSYTREDLLQYHSHPNRCHFFLKPFKNQTPLHWAALAGRTDTVRDILRQLYNFYKTREDGPESILEYIDTEDSEGNTALWYALESNHLPVARQLIKHNAYIHQVDKNSMTLLHMAIKKKKPETVSLLCQAEQSDLQKFYKSTQSHSQYQKKQYSYYLSQLPALSLIAFQNQQKENPVDICPQELLFTLEKHVAFLKDFLEKIPFLEQLETQITATRNAIASYYLLTNNRLI